MKEDKRPTDTKHMFCLLFRCVNNDDDDDGDDDASCYLTGFFVNVCVRML